MKVISRRAAMADLARSWAKKGQTIGFVPTMGALHEGHASLIRRARKENARAVVSVFVNPAQFAPTEDLSRYPRPFAEDKRLCAALKADALYHPSVSEVYPDGFSTSVEVGGLAKPLEGEIRPGHFRGVATVVLKLLETVRPDRAYFGEKDFQQLQVVARMAKDLDLAPRIVPCATVRESDGLALSSRNRYLSPEERSLAPRFHAALQEGARLAREGRLSPPEIGSRVSEKILAVLGTTVDYVRLADPATLEEAKACKGRLRLLGAVRLGSTRLIDNIAVTC